MTILNFVLKFIRKSANVKRDFDKCYHFYDLVVVKFKKRMSLGDVLQN
jgi:hypothetical protein